MNDITEPSPLVRVLRITARILLVIAIAIMALWAAAAVYCSNLPAEWLRRTGAILFVLAVGSSYALVRPLPRAHVIFFGLFLIVVAWFLLIPPSNSRDWQPDVSVLPYAEVSGDVVTIHNVRNCSYRSETDYTVRHYDKTVELSRLKSVDLYVVTWGSPLIAHTLLSFGFEGDTYLCFSIETRREKGEEYSAVKGFFRQFELTYVVGDERDLIRLRTNYRGEQVYLYRLKTDAGTARNVFLSYLHHMNLLKNKPEWYNAATSNCTTNIRGHTAPYARNHRWDWRILINGFVDKMAYERGTLDRSMPFQELKSRSHINSRAKACEDVSRFCRVIREGLPGMAQ